jgi:uncharacterized membrane protein
MKILLLNDNPVVNKLVTLSAHKTSDELDVVNSIDNIPSTHYGLLVVDDTLYNEELFKNLKQKITFSQSLYICARGAEPIKEFTSTLRKPFLPTDLVELFSEVSHKIDNNDLKDEEILENEIEEIEELDAFSLDNELSLDDDISLDDTFSLEDDFEDEDNNTNILDFDEAQKVKDLLDETSDDLLNLDNDLENNFDFDTSDELESDAFAENQDLDDENEFEDDLNSDLLEDEENQFEDDLNSDLTEDEDINMDEQIQMALSELSEDDLESEVDTQEYLETPMPKIDSLDSLTSRDIKLAIGEKVEEEIAPVIKKSVPKTIDKNPTNKQKANDGVEALKNLLSALTDHNVAASLNNMKISINITLGDK